MENVNMIFISAQSWDFQFVWQLEVQIVNFRKFEISDKMHVLIWYPHPDTNPDTPNFKMWFDLARKYPEVKFFFYRDKGLSVSDFQLYVPQLRPQILAQHFDNYPELTKEVIFYHDCDIIFNKLPDFDKLSEDEINWQSNTSEYLDYAYLRKKERQGKIPENEAISILCGIGNVSVETMKSYTGKTGGAQYILKGIDGDFWRDVERQVIEIRKAFHYSQPDSVNKKYFDCEDGGFQSWCADMWAVNMALWSRNKVTDITKELDFSWATDDEETYLNKNIYHNAGATGRQAGIFYKGHWSKKSPIGKLHAIKKNSASYYYVKAIAEVK
jgi:hypothetical protein